jgi:hypothetical protein
MNWTANLPLSKMILRTNIIPHLDLLEGAVDLFRHKLSWRRDDHPTELGLPYGIAG